MASWRRLAAAAISAARRLPVQPLERLSLSLAAQLHTG